MKVFSKQMMLDRLEKEGRYDQVDEKSLKIMDMLDGKEAMKNDFKALVHDELEYFVRHDGKNYPVNPNDCVEKFIGTKKITLELSLEDIQDIVMALVCFIYSAPFRAQAGFKVKAPGRRTLNRAIRLYDILKEHDFVPFGEERFTELKRTIEEIKYK